MHRSNIRDEVTYEIKPLRLQFPGATLKNLDFQQAIIEIIQRRKKELEYERKCFPNKNDIQVFRYSDIPPGYQIRPTFAGVRQLIQELDLPEYSGTVYHSRIFNGWDFSKYSLRQPFKKYQRYTVEIFGLRIRPPDLPSVDKLLSLPDPAQYKCPPMYWEEYGMFLIQVWRVRIFSCPTESIQTSPSNPLSPHDPDVLYYEEYWHPRRGIGWRLGGQGNLRDLHTTGKVNTFIKDAQLVLRGVHNIQRKPPKPTGFTNRASFNKAYTDSYFNLFKEKGYKPKQEAVARELKICRSTLHNYLTYFKLSWPPHAP